MSSDAPLGLMSDRAECIALDGLGERSRSWCDPLSGRSALSQRSGQNRNGSGHAAESRCSRYGLMSTVVPAQDGAPAGILLMT